MAETKITKREIEGFCNRHKEKDAPYIKYDMISPILLKTIIEILEYQDR